MHRFKKRSGSKLTAADLSVLAAEECVEVHSFPNGIKCATVFNSVGFRVHAYLRFQRLLPHIFKVLHMVPLQDFLEAERTLNVTLEGNGDNFKHMTTDLGKWLVHFGRNHEGANEGTESGPRTSGSVQHKVVFVDTTSASELEVAKYLRKLQIYVAGLADYEGEVGHRDEADPPATLRISIVSDAAVLDWRRNGIGKLRRPKTLEREWVPNLLASLAPVRQEDGMAGATTVPMMEEVLDGRGRKLGLPQLSEQFFIPLMFEQSRHVLLVPAFVAPSAFSELEYQELIEDGCAAWERISASSSSSIAVPDCGQRSGSEGVHFHLLKVNVATFFSSHVGATEQNIRRCFAYLDQLASSALEGDADEKQNHQMAWPTSGGKEKEGKWCGRPIGPRVVLWLSGLELIALKDHRDDHLRRSALTTLLLCLDGISAASKRLAIVAPIDCPVESLEDALTRPGRFFLTLPKCDSKAL